MKKRRLVAVIMALTLVAGLAGCGSDTGKKEKKKEAGASATDTVVLDVTSEPGSLNPMLMSDTISQSVLTHSMAGLTRLDKNDQPVADVAEKWDINEENTVYTMHLRKDAKWSNGDPVTANDFYFSWVTQMKQETGSPLASFLYSNIKNGKDFYEGKLEESELGIKVIDDNTLEIEWAHPMSSGLFLLALPIYFPMNEKAYEEIGADNYAKDAEQLVTNGPYKVAEWEHDDHILLEKVEDYYNADSINVPNVKLVMIGDDNTRLNAFVAGEIDMCNMYSEQITQLEKKDVGSIESYIDGASWFLDFNTQDEVMSNVNMRKALAYSVDTQSLLDNVIDDGSVAADGFVPGVIAGADEESYAKARGSLFSYDVEEAKSYLESALTELGKSASDITIKLSATDTTYNQNQAAYIQQQWETNLGIKVEIDVKAWKALYEAKTAGDYQVYVNGWGPSRNDAMDFLEIFRSTDSNNFGKYTNPKYDELVAAAESESDAMKRQDLMIQAEQLLMEDQAMGPLYFTCTSYALSDKLKNIVRTPFQLFNMWDGAEIVTQ